MISKVIIFCCFVAFARTDTNGVVRIHGGHNAELGQYPFYVSLYCKVTYGDDIISFCGGAILNRQWILTAAYCAYSVKHISDIVVKAGSINYGEYSETEQKSDVAASFPHPKYSSPIGPYDIALMKMSTPFEFNKFVSMVHLPRAEGMPTGSGTVTGLGFLKYVGDPYLPDVLQAVTLSIISNDECQALIDNILGGFDNDFNLIDRLRFCTGPTEQNQGYCLQDTGGPFTTIENDKIVLAGMATFGFAADCETPGAPSIYTRISAFIDWIEQTISTNTD